LKRKKSKEKINREKSTFFFLMEGCQKCKSFLFEDTSCDCPDVNWVLENLEIPRMQKNLDYYIRMRAEAEKRKLFPQVQIIDNIIAYLNRRLGQLKSNKPKENKKRKI
jgi:hypothetical protein